MAIEITPLGDQAVLVSFGKEISEKIHQRIHQFLQAFEIGRIYGVVECVPAYTTVAIYYVPSRISYRKLTEKVQAVYQSISETASIDRIVYQIPVYYGGETGPDLPDVAKNNQISEEEVVQIHANQEYLIYMIGFVPGFPYLGGLSKKLSTPRLASPRPKVAAGSVGIGGDQTGIYPMEVPSGWNIIGITPITIFSLEKNPPSLLSAGNYVKFVPIGLNEFLKIKSAKEYKVETYRRSDCMDESR